MQRLRPISRFIPQLRKFVRFGDTLLGSVFNGEASRENCIRVSTSIIGLSSDACPKSCCSFLECRMDGSRCVTFLAVICRMNPFRTSTKVAQQLRNSLVEFLLGRGRVGSLLL